MSQNSGGVVKRGLVLYETECGRAGSGRSRERAGGDTRKKHTLVPCAREWLELSGCSVTC